MQEPDAQSVLVTHVKPSAHGGHIGPPQSFAVSKPSLVPFAHSSGFVADIDPQLPPSHFEATDPAEPDALLPCGDASFPPEAALCTDASGLVLVALTPGLG